MRSLEQRLFPKKPENNGEPIQETETTVSYLGVTLPKAEDTSGRCVPNRAHYTDYINDNEIALPLQRDIAIAFASGEPMLVEGGTSLGKTTTVKKMAADLGWEVHYANLNGATDVEDLMGRYIPNPDRKSPEDPEYRFTDGKITSGLRQEEGKIKVIILDEFNATAPNILIRLHEVLDALERGSDVVLSEDASEAVPTSKHRTKIIALMNPPGRGYFGREPLDPAQLRRWVYKKMPTELPKETFSEATDALFFGTFQGETTKRRDARFITQGEGLQIEQLADIPGIAEMLAKYKEFHQTVKNMLKERKIAEDQPQQFTFDDRMEPRRVRDFILRFYQGNITETFQQALRYFYSNKLESPTDKQKLEEIIHMCAYIPKPTDSKRRGLERDSSPEKRKLIQEIERLRKGADEKIGKKESGSSMLEQAQEIMGDQFLGPAAVERTFGFELKPEDIPEIPYTKEQLEQAKKLGERLVLRIHQDNKGKPLTFKRIEEILTVTTL